MYEKLIELLEPYMSGEPCDAESGSCELTNCRTCDAITLANRLIFHDLVPVVRCKDCKYVAEVGRFGCYCRKEDAPWFNDTFEVYMDIDDFCSHGERRDTNGN